MALTTVITVLENLRKKKAVRAVPATERARKYRANVAKHAAAAGRLKELIPGQRTRAHMRTLFAAVIVALFLLVNDGQGDELMTPFEITVIP